MILTFALLIFMVLAWMREHGRWLREVKKSIELEAFGRRVIAEIAELEAGDRARAQVVTAPLPPPGAVLPKCFMCGARMRPESAYGWLGDGKAIVCATSSSAVLGKV